MSDKWLSVLIRFDKRLSSDREMHNEWKRLVMLTGGTKKALIFLLKMMKRKNDGSK